MELPARLATEKNEDFKRFENMNTSAENIVRYIHDSIKDKLPKRISLLYVEVTETGGWRARYSKKLSV
jgi:6-pyruvoyl-tetrahydropterin synthase